VTIVNKAQEKIGSNRAFFLDVTICS
jgi:hypothetical protein